MEEQIVRLLTDTQSAAEATRKNAEWQLKQQYTNPQFPIGLCTVGAHSDIPIAIRQAALLYLKIWVLACWSPQFDEFSGPFFADDGRKSQIRQMLLDLALSDRDERKIKSAASLVVSKIATVDFPDDWPDLLPTVLNVVSNARDNQLHGALKVLGELVDDCFSEDQFFKVARDLVKAMYNIAVNEDTKRPLRALAVSVFRSCFDTLEMVLENHKAEVKKFAVEALAGWMPFFVSTLKTPLGPPPSEEAEATQSGAVELYRGSVALKLQVVKVLMRIRSVFPALLSPQTPTLFEATWQELSALQAQYQQMYIHDERQGRLEDADGLPYTLDFLVLEELDFMQACLRAPPVRSQLDRQLGVQGNQSSWVNDVVKIAAAYAQITTEEEGLWEIDVNIFLSEEANVTANYTPRTACGDLIMKMGEWIDAVTLEGLLSHTRDLYNTNAGWKSKEAALYLLNQLLCDLQGVDKEVGGATASGYVDFIKHAMQEEAAFLRARGFLVAGSLVRCSGNTLQTVAVSFMEASLHAMTNDESEVVKVACIRALQYYFASLPPSATLAMQPTIIAALSHFFHSQDLGELNDSDDLLITLIETLRDAIVLDTTTCFRNGGIDLLFAVASRGASNFQIVLLAVETFEEIVGPIVATGPELYAELAAKVLPTLMGAFDVASLTEESALADLAANLLSALVAEGSSPMPQGLIATVMPRLVRLLLGSQDEELLKSVTTAVTYMLRKDPDQMFEWQDQAGKGGLEVVLIIIDRLLNPNVDDNAAAEVGGLAAEVVEKAGSEKLGPYLVQLLRAVALRLATAEKASFIQSLILVFARLSLNSAQEVVEFLAQEQLLQAVISKWLENSTNFAGYEEIRQNVIALVRLYELNDPRLAEIQVKGDMIMPKSDRIMTRSRARQQPDQWTSITAQLKIVKVLVEELLSASTNPLDSTAAADGDNDDDDDSDDGNWEDDPSEAVDLGLGAIKQQLMSYAADDGAPVTRSRDDETQTFLLQFFRSAAHKPGFEVVFNALTPEEQEKLRSTIG